MYSDMRVTIAYWIAFGPHGPRAVAPPDEGRKIFYWTSAAVGLSVVLFVIIRMFARDPPKTMTQEYQEMTNEYLKVRAFDTTRGFQLWKTLSSRVVRSLCSNIGAKI